MHWSNSIEDLGSQFLVHGRRNQEKCSRKNKWVAILFKLTNQLITKIILGLCGDCSDKLNHHSKKREVKRLTKSKRKQTRSPKSSDIKSELRSPQEPSSSTNSTPIPQDSHEDPTDTREEPEIVRSSNQESLWKKSDEVEHKDRNFDDYLEDLLL